MKGKFKATVVASALLSVAVALWFFARSETEFWLKALLPLSAPDLRPLPLILLCTAAWFAITLPLKRLFKRWLKAWSLWWLFADGFLLLPLPLIANVDVLAVDASWDTAFWGGLEEAALWRVLFMVAAFWLWWALSDDRSDFQGSLSSQLLCFPLSAFVPFALAWALMAVAVFGCATLGLFALLFKIDTWPLWRAILVGGGNAAGSYVRFFTSLDALPFGRVASFIWLVSASALIGFLAFNASMKARNASLGICANVRMLGNAKFAGDVEVGRGRTGVESTDSGIYAWVNVANGSVAERWLNMKLQLDTGATYTKISKRKLKFLGAKPVGTVIETLADGRKIKRKYGLVYMECCGEGSFASVVFGEKRDAEVLGMTAAHALGLLRELRRQAGQTTAQQAPVPVQQTTAPAQQTVACQQAPVQAPKTVEPVVLFKELACEDCMEARERIYKAGFAAVYLGKNALTDKHVFLPVAYELAKALASGEKVASKDKEVKEALERLVLAGYLDEVDEGFRMKSEDVKRDLEVQVMRLRELYLKRATGYVV